MESNRVFDDQVVAALRLLGRRRQWHGGAELYREGDRSAWVAILERGQVKVTAQPEADSHDTVLAVRGPGDLIGELSAVDGRPRSATVVALEELEATVVDAAAFRGFLNTHPGAVVRLLQVVSSRLRDADRKRAEYGVQDATTRVARRLTELASRFGHKEPSGVEVDLALTQHDLAGWVGASRESVSRALRQLRDEKVIRTSPGSVCVLDLDALRERAHLP